MAREKAAGGGRRPRWRWAFFAAACWLSTALTVSAQSAEASEESAKSSSGDVGAEEEASEDRFEIWALTFGPGDHPFSKFGHNALLVRDRVRERDLVYNFGTYDTSDDQIISKFLQGRLLYWVSLQSFEGTLLGYRAQDREVAGQRLALSEESTRRLVRELREAAKPENRYYRYDYYRENCSTKVRDLLDEATGGALRRAARRPAEMNFRQHTLRLSQSDFLLTRGLDVALGPVIDQPRTRWEEMFLPGVLQKTLRDVRGGDGQPLVVEERIFVASSRPDAPSKLPLHWPWTLLLGTLLGGTVFSLAWLEARAGRPWVRRGTQVLGLLLSSGIGLCTGVLGSLLLFFWLGTDHGDAARNENTLVFPVWTLLLPILSPLALGLGWARQWIVCVCALSFVSTLVAASLLLLPDHLQDTGAFVALGLPLWGLMSAAWVPLFGIPWHAPRRP